MPQSKQKRRARSRVNDLATTTLTDDAIAVGALKARGAARFLSISLPTLRRQVRDGKLIPNRYTRHLIFSVKELNRWLEEGQVQ